MRRPLTACIFLVLAALLGGSLVASAATSNDTACRKATVSGSVSNGELLAYDACRFDKLDAQLAALKPTSGSTPTPTPTSTPSSTPKPSAPASSTPTTPAGTTCSRGAEVVKFNGQGSAGLGEYGQGDYNASAEEW